MKVRVWRRNLNWTVSAYVSIVAERKALACSWMVV